MEQIMNKDRIIVWGKQKKPDCISHYLTQLDVEFHTFLTFYLLPLPQLTSLHPLLFFSFQFLYEAALGHVIKQPLFINYPQRGLSSISGGVFEFVCVSESERSLQF